jgi:hypothetical protein
MPRPFLSQFRNIEDGKARAGPGGVRPGPSARTSRVFASVFDSGSGGWRGLGLLDPLGYDFRPNASSPLRGAGFIYPPFSPQVGGGPPDVGAYQHRDADPWEPGCTLPTCDSFRDGEAAIEW